jgi:hypothetical protein
MRHVIIENYTFTPSTNTVFVNGKNLRPEQLLLITDVTTGVVLYNFSDPSLGANITNSVSTSTGLETCNVVLSYNCSGLNSTDKISILYEESYDLITPNETMRDPVDKLRVSEPQGLIDTDFEYGAQPGKWENLNLLNNRPSMFYSTTQAITNTATSLNFWSNGGNSQGTSYTLTNVAASGNLVTVSMNNTTGIANGTPIFIQGTLDMGNADGWWLANNVVANTSFQYITTSTPASTLFNPNKTYIYPGYWFTGSSIPIAGSVGGNMTVAANSVVTVTTTNDHGLRVGSGIYVTSTTGATGGSVNGSWLVSTTPTSNTFTYTSTATGGTITTTANATLYPRPLGYIESRPQLGGIAFTNLTAAHGYQTIRQTRRNFRYQAGKGIQFSTGSSMKPIIYINSVTSSGTTCTVNTLFPHGLNPGAVVTIAGAVPTTYNGNFTVVTAPSPTTFTYTAASTPASSPATGYPITANPYSWYGSKNRIGMFSDQNGMFFEYDGQTLYAVKRSATTYTAGTIAVTTGSQTVTGTNTLFASQLTPGQSIVLAGQTYVVQQITSNTTLYIYPEYRGTNNIVSDYLSVVIDTKYPQSTWNIDPCNGTGASLFNVDLTKMQMFYMDYSWYGAGAIRFGFKNNRGEVIYCHRVPNNNLNQVAFLRSGNQPARYETNTQPPITQLAATLNSSATTGASISVANVSGFPSTGTVVITQSAATAAAIEYISYTGIVGNTFTIGSRAQTGGNASAQTFTYSATAPIKVELYSPQASSTLNHWGTSVIIDGGQTPDTSYVFSAGMANTLSNQASNVRSALMSIRLAPSSDNGQTGVLGVREIITRMQVLPAQIDAYTTGNTSFRMDLVLNGVPSGGTFIPTGGSSLTQFCLHGANTTIFGGETIYSFFTTPNSATSQPLTAIRDVGTSILSGGTSFNVPTTPANLYPDGPDILTICATPLNGTNSVNARFSWTENQA